MDSDHLKDGSRNVKDKTVVSSVIGTLYAMMQLVEEEEEEEGTSYRRWGGSTKGKTPNIRRDVKASYETLVQQYFSGHLSLYNEDSFKMGFGSPRKVVERLFLTVSGCNLFVEKCYMTTKRPGIRPIVRFAACMTMLVYSHCANGLNEHLQMPESLVKASLKDLCRLVVSKFSEYLNRCPTVEEKELVLKLMKQRRFLGLFGSWYCKHYLWSKCTIVLAGQCKGKESGGKTLVMEAMVDPGFYIWYFNFDAPGLLNDINILDRSNIVGALLSSKFDGKVPEYISNGMQRDWLYFLVDCIYPSWGIFAKSYKSPNLPPKIIYTMTQEHVRKHIKGAFGVLIAHFGALKRNLHRWYINNIQSSIATCIVIHYRTIEVRRDEYSFLDLMNVPTEERGEEGEKDSLFLEEKSQVGELTVQSLVERVGHMSVSMEDVNTQAKLMVDLVVHITATRG